MANKRGRQFSLDVRDKPGLASPGDRRLQYWRVGGSQARLARSLLIELTRLRFSNRMPHSPALCVRRLGTLRGHRSLSCDLTLLTTTPFTPPRLVMTRPLTRNV